jgi:membrane-bound ClpP family serine protease
MQTALIAVVAGYLVASFVGVAVAVGNDWPAAAGGILQSDRPVWVDALAFNGTALSAPLYLLVLLAVFLVLSLRHGRRGTVGLIGLAAIGLVTALGMISEPIMWRSLAPGTFTALPAAIALVLLFLSCLMAYLAVRQLRARRARR